MDLSQPPQFSRAYDEHAGAVYGTAYRILGDPALAQDVTQDVFLRLWRRPDRFDSTRGKLGSYLRLMAHSRAVDLWREAGAAARATERLAVVPGADDARPDDLPDVAAERSADAEAVRAALRVLPGPQREAVLLAYWGGLTADEIARRAGIPLGTAKSRLRLGMARLRGEFAAAAA